MALQAKQDLFTDVDPNGPDTGRILTSGQPGIAFKLVGKGGVLGDALAKRFGAVEGDLFQPYDAAAEAEAREAANVATYTTNRAMGLPNHNGYPQPLPAQGVAFVQEATSSSAPAVDSTDTKLPKL